MGEKEAAEIIQRLEAKVASLKAEVERNQSLIGLQDKLMWEKDGLVLTKNAEIERLRAEVERLTPREMGLQEACDVLNKRRLRGREWHINTDETHVSDLHNTVVFTKHEVILIAQGLERDAKGGG